MRIIQDISKKVNRFYSCLKSVPGTYRPSIFNFIVHDNEAIIFNSMSRLIAVLSDQECAILEKESIIVEESDLQDGILYDLIEKRLLVSASENEADTYMNICDMVGMIENAKNSDDHITDYTILSTTACNARCFYCFEADFKPTAMSTQTAEDLVEYIIKNSDGKKMCLHWFGGEPLCNTRVMDLISERLIAEGYSIASSITTNGLLFDDENVKKAKELWHTNTIQITLDGLGEEHNRRKNYKGAVGDPFARTIENIHLLLKENITVSLRLNFDNENCENIYELIDFLKKEFEGEKYLVSYPAMLFENCAAWNPERLPEEQKELLQKLFKLRDAMEECGLYSPPTLSKALKLTRCGSNRRNHRTVNPDGRFSVCHNVSDGDTYGSIYEGISDKNEFEKWMCNSRLNEKCKNCCWLPECTAFDQCPIKRSTCIEETNDLVSRQLRKAYRKYMEANK